MAPKRAKSSASKPGKKRMRLADRGERNRPPGDARVNNQAQKPAPGLCSDSGSDSDSDSDSDSSVEPLPGEHGARPAQSSEFAAFLALAGAATHTTATTTSRPSASNTAAARRVAAPPAAAAAEEGYVLDGFSFAPSELLSSIMCVVCHEIARDPQRACTDCDYVICSDCHAGRVEFNAGACKPTLCYMNCERPAAMRRYGLAASILEAAGGECVLCHEKLSFGRFATTHMCAKLEQKCPNAGCPAMLRAHELADHATSRCPKRVFSCVFCREPVPIADKAVHTDAACKEMRACTVCGERVGAGTHASHACVRDMAGMNHFAVSTSQCIECGSTKYCANKCCWRTLAVAKLEQRTGMAVELRSTDAGIELEFKNTTRRLWSMNVQASMKLSTCMFNGFDAKRVTKNGVAYKDERKEAMPLRMEIKEQSAKVGNTSQVMAINFSLQCKETLRKGGLVEIGLALRWQFT